MGCLYSKGNVRFIVSEDTYDTTETETESRQ
ncbi:rCG62929, partial [Rattus norvegicus]